MLSLSLSVLSRILGKMGGDFRPLGDIAGGGGGGGGGGIDGDCCCCALFPWLLPFITTMEVGLCRTGRDKGRSLSKDLGCPPLGANRSA